MSRSKRDKLRVAGAIIVLLGGVAAFLAGKLVKLGVVGDVLEHLGTFVATAVLVSFLYDYFLREKHAADTLVSLQDVLTGPSMLVLINDHDTKLHGRIESELRAWLETHVQQAGVWGLSGFERSFNYAAVFDRLDNGDELLWLNNFCPDGIKYRDALVSAVQRGASVKMLVAEPDSVPSNLRALEIETQEEFSTAAARS
ncbi:hypothetical protein AB0B66_18885 [Catellatospora sp. NPDC049111]|uniref:hypothetical protein n=1 Tax=Catellatospora sp. NPDC049111 TaxID=3155271 RepID=UPI0033CAE7F1